MLLKYGTILDSGLVLLDYGLILDPALETSDYGLILDLFPVLPGITWNRTRTPIWSTVHQEAFSGIEVSTSRWSYPRWRWTLEIEVLRSALAYQELQDLVGFVNARKGAGSVFYYEDPEDYIIEDQILGIGNGTTAAYQLVRDYGEYRAEPIKHINGDPTIYLDGVATTAWSIDAAGLVTFDAAPADKTVITADFSYYWQVRFLEDEAEFEALWYKFWNQKKLEFISRK